MLRVSWAANFWEVTCRSSKKNWKEISSFSIRALSPTSEKILLFYVRGETEVQRSIPSFDVHFELFVHVVLTFVQKHSPAATTLLYVFFSFHTHILETGGQWHRCRYCSFHWISNFMSEMCARPTLVLLQSFQVEFLLHPMKMQRANENVYSIFVFVVVAAAVLLFSPHSQCYTLLGLWTSSAPFAVRRISLTLYSFVAWTVGTQTAHSNSEAHTEHFFHKLTHEKK